MPQGTCKSASFKRLVVDFTHQGKNAAYHFWCSACLHRFFRTQDERANHLAIRHHACPTCLQVFANPTARVAHQKSTGHCFCSDCDEGGQSFPTLEALVHHQCTLLQVDKYECLTCAAYFSKETAFVIHFDTCGHDPVHNRKAMEDQQTAFAAVQLARVEESNLWCEECKKHFIDIRAYKDHKSSAKHKVPTFVIECHCKKEFKIFSAFVHHLESKTCKIKVTRNQLNAAIYRYDADRRITMTKYADRFAGMSIAGSSTTSIAPDDSASILEFKIRTLSIDSSRTAMVRDRAFTPDDSATSMVSSQGGVMLTPDSSDHASTDSESINTPPGSDSGGGAILSTSAGSERSASSSHSESIFTPTGSTVSDRSIASAFTPYGESVSDGNDEGEEGVVVFTPQGSSVNGASDEWSFLRPSTVFTPSSTSIDDSSSVATIRYDTATKSWPCPDCSRTFMNSNDLRQHMDSAVHAQKIFHCPTSVSDNGNNTGFQDREFKTMSGLMQHIEEGACKTGQDAMKTIISIMERPMRKKFNATITPLEK
jgi:hypothetical protein